MHGPYLLAAQQHARDGRFQPQQLFIARGVLRGVQHAHGGRQHVGPVQPLAPRAPQRMPALEGPRPGHCSHRGVSRRRAHAFELRADAAGGLCHFRAQQLQPRPREAVGRTGHADGTAHHAFGVDDGRAHAAHAHHDLLVVNGVAARSGDIELRVEAAAIGDGERRERLQRQVAHDGVACRALHGRQDGLALAGAVHRLALAQHRGRALAVGAVAAFQRDHLQPVQRGEVAGLAGEVAQAAHLVRGGGHQVRHGVGLARHLEAAKTQPVDLAQRIAPQHAARHQRGQQPVHRGARQRELRGQVALADAAGGGANRFEHVDGFLDCAGTVTGIHGHGGLSQYMEKTKESGGAGPLVSILSSREVQYHAISQHS